MVFDLSEAKILNVLVQLFLNTQKSKISGVLEMHKHFYEDGCGMNPMMRRFIGGM